jgi:hypothetical protein
VRLSGPADDRLARTEHTLDPAADRAHGAAQDTDSFFLSGMHVKRGRKRASTHPERESKQLASRARAGIGTRDPLPHSRSLDGFTTPQESGLLCRMSTLLPPPSIMFPPSRLRGRYRSVGLMYEHFDVD